ncbi:hypothetical protein VNO78_27257 [Psophocarpus tetragonolobus]|uniref:Protein kinase domain-containing protein n=1 Tax=Psophocarpus tetragonolobus TaxID=3891 RepID=A0AAN9S0R8_PSOTE
MPKAQETLTVVEKEGTENKEVLLGQRYLTIEHHIWIFGNFKVESPGLFQVQGERPKVVMIVVTGIKIHEVEFPVYNAIVKLQKGVALFLLQKLAGINVVHHSILFPAVLELLLMLQQVHSLAKAFGSGLDEEITLCSSGYIPPEFSLPDFDTLTTKFDVYCFGVVLFELLIEKKSIGD